MISVTHSRECLEYEVYTEYVHAGEVILIEWVEVNPREFLLFRQVIVQAPQEAPEASQEMGRKEHKEKQCDEVHIVSHFHDVVATGNKEAVENRAKKFE